jgi:hypothetical protein
LGLADRGKIYDLLGHIAKVCGLYFLANTLYSIFSFIIIKKVQDPNKLGTAASFQT